MTPPRNALRNLTQQELSYLRRLDPRNPELEREAAARRKYGGRRSECASGWTFFPDVDL